ncbi:PH domain-containing protein [Mucilaginibacter rubeus]|uniref:PH domain-containing protein n=1 Tax=Mucilaginibacter rubeus TaxID=2027860 RepID=A0AAE6MKW1_9SPHI|nr:MULTISPECIES: PH domain-containing protein [Mucilaginibacter]QEM07248.1 PH domain-containing protein [Mucilaginibacter rubeus]QEM19704.1 PH domain-containing protein [Mucilaginibacter gossypii]QTE43599.1 PH domain-containing protein [Mucilaginibacter rubeus]QTE50199.1 PH domain-containing protein [Mucilaginibacter rubeus]QTE55287.1 PH domain-containing protein [Mucilaginibacter rubeus]
MNLHQVWIAPVRPSIRYTAICTAPWLFVFFILTVAGYYVFPLLIVGSWVSLFAFLYHVLLLKSHTYFITPEYFLVSKGLLKKQVAWVEHLKIKDYFIHQTPIMNLVDVVNITIVSEGSPAIRFTLKGVSNSGMKNTFGDLIEFLEVRKNYYQKMIDAVEPLSAMAQ